MPLFDGKTFAGWEGNMKVFRIEDQGRGRRFAQGIAPSERVLGHDAGIRRLRIAAESEADRPGLLGQRRNSNPQPARSPTAPK